MSDADKELDEQKDAPAPPAEPSTTTPDQTPAPDSATDAPPADEEPEEEGLTLIEHLQELRVRLVRCFIAVGVGFLACYGFSQELFDYLQRPLLAVLPEHSTFIFTSLPEAFFTYIKLALVAGAFVTSPYLFYQTWRFIAPGLYDEERKLLVPVAFFSAFFFVTGALFGYFVVFPYAFGFFMSFGSDVIRPMPALSDYLGFTLKMLFAFGLVFELPLFIFFLARLGIVTPAQLAKVRKYAILGAFIVGAILTPPDVISQCLMAGPLILLYEIGIIVARMFGKRRKGEEAEAPAEEENPKEPANA